MRGFGVRPNLAKVDVSETACLGIPAVFCAINAISSDVGKIPAYVNREDERGVHTRVNSHPVRRLLKKPNPEMTGLSFRQAVVASALLYGNGYAEIERDRGGRPIALWPIESWRVQPYRDSNQRLYFEVSPSSWYPTGSFAAKGKQVYPEDMLHIKEMSLNGILGLMKIQLGANSMALSIAAEQYGASFFGNSARPSGYIEYPSEKKLSPEGAKNLLNDWHAAHSGHNANSTGLLADGAKFTKIDTPNDSAQFLETRLFELDSVARWFRISPGKLMNLVKTSYNSLEQLSIEYTQDTLGFWIRQFEEEVDSKLFLSSEGDLCLDLDETALIRGDTLSTYDAVTKAVLGSVMTQNEGRARINLPPVEGGDSFLIPKNTVPVGADDSVEDRQKVILATPAKPAMNDPAQTDHAADPEATPTEPAEPTLPVDAPADNSEAVRSMLGPVDGMLRDLAARWVHLEHDKATREAKKPSYRSWSETFPNTHGQRIKVDLLPILTVIRSAAAVLNAKCPAASDLADGLVEKYLTDLRGELDEDGLSERMAGWKEFRGPAFAAWAVDHLKESLS